MPPKQRKSIIGDFLSSTIAPGLTLLGTAIGGPVGGILGSGVGSAAAPYLAKLKKGGKVVMQSPDVPKAPKKKLGGKRLKKGSSEARARMAAIRAMRK